MRTSFTSVCYLVSESFSLNRFWQTFTLELADHYIKK